MELAPDGLEIYHDWSDDVSCLLCTMKTQLLRAQDGNVLLKDGIHCSSSYCFY